MFSKMIFRVGIVLPLFVGSTAMIGSGVILELVSPTTPAIAQTTFNTNLLLELADKETYAVFIARAEANAEVKVQELFDKDLLRTEVRLTVLGQNGAAIAPVLKLRVSRQEWTTYPDPEIWSVYYPESQIFLNLIEAPTPEPEVETETEEVLPILEETFITPTGETLLNDESITEPTNGDVIIETPEELESSEEDTTDSPNGSVEPTESDTTVETETDGETKPSESNTTTDNDEGIESSNGGTTRRRLIFEPAE